MASRKRPTLADVIEHMDTLAETVAGLVQRLAVLERAQRRDVARDNATPYLCANQVSTEPNCAAPTEKKR